MLNAHNLSYEVNQKQILHDISLEVSAGQMFGILGPNGAGKSTLLKCLSGYQKPSAGNIQMDGISLDNLDLKELAYKRAVLTQQVVVNFPFTVLQIAAMGRGHGTDFGNSNVDFDIAKQSLELTEVQHLQDRQMSSLSGGEQQRVHMARVLAQLGDKNDALLFLDEPTSSLDLKHQFLLFDICKDLAAKRGFTIIVVLHDLHMARRVCDRVLMLREGRTFSQGGVQDVITAKAISELYEISISRVHI